MARINYWTVLKKGPGNSYCRCICGTERWVRTRNLKRGMSTNCGCRATRGRVEHGHCRISGRSPTYSSWRGMIDRCTYSSNASWPRYGGRGIRVCERWKNFENFLEDMGEKPSSDHDIDREDVDGDYTPENCQWLHKSKNRDRYG